MAMQTPTRHPFIYGRPVSGDEFLNRDSELSTIFNRTLVDIANVEQAIPDVFKSGEQALIWLWNGLSPAEKIYAAALAEMAAEDVTIPEEQVIQVLATHAARLRTREVELASRDLVKRRVLEVAGEREYRFSIELFRLWVRQNKPWRDVKDEIDQIDPLAEQFFKLGEKLFGRRLWDTAIRYFQDALKANCHHFRARLYLAESLLQLGQIDSAVAELEQAYQLDKDEAKFALIRGLLSQAKTRGKAGDEEGVLAVCERILDISAHEREALALQSVIWTRRGDAALAKNDLEAALRAYQTAGDHEKTAQVEILRQRQDLATVERQAQTYVKAERWTKAAAIYQQLVTQAPDEDSRRTWEKELKRCQEEQELAFVFAQGLQAMQEEEWKQAQQAFLQVVNRRIEYQKDGRWATELLDQARKRKASQIKAIPVTTQTSPPKQNLDVNELHNILLQICDILIFFES
ncbi:MAG: tetratricopeptide repeat protein [Ardenticatenaceae bacterium]